MPTVDAPTGNGLVDNLINPNPNLCGHDGQRKRVAHMPTATTSTAVGKLKSNDIHPLECAMKQDYDTQPKCHTQHEPHESASPNFSCRRSLLGQSH
jgi:hypothetical protein